VWHRTSYCSSRRRLGRASSDSNKADWYRCLTYTLGVYQVADITELSAALNGFALSELLTVCYDRIELLRSRDSLDSCDALLRSDSRADQVSFLLLAYACCVNHAKWFVDHEALLLKRKAEALTSTQRIKLLGVLEVHAQPLELHSFHAVDFEHVPSLVAARKVRMHNGSAYVHDDQLLTVVQRTYEMRLKAFVSECQRRLNQIAHINTDHCAPQFATILNTLADVQRRVCPVAPCVFGRLACTAQTLPVLIAQFAPLCVVRLAIKLRERGHLVDQERVTLRLFLYAANVPLDVAVEYWCTHVHEEKKVRAALALVYDKKYTCVGCTKIRAGGLCPFEDSNKSLLSWSLDTMPSAVRDIEDIVGETNFATERCARFFALRHGRPGTKIEASRNPALYFARALEARTDEGAAGLR